MDITLKNIISGVVDVLLENNSYKAEKYLSEKLVVRATRRIFGGKIVKGNIEVLLVVGKPNYAQRAFIKRSKKNKLMFPLKQIILTSVPVPKKKTKKHGK